MCNCNLFITAAQKNESSFDKRHKHIPDLSLLAAVYLPAGDPSALVVLVEEELVVIDLQTEGWPIIQTPYLVPLHSSAITCSHHVSTIPLKLWERIFAAGKHQNAHYSKKVNIFVN